MPVPASRPQACVASTFTDRQPGGITTVVRQVLDAFADDFAWTWIARIDDATGHPTDYARRSPEGRRPVADGQLRTVAPGRWTRPLLRRVGWTIFQPGGSTVAPALFGQALRRSVARQFPERPALVYWVGAGIELMGFELARRARAAGAPFVVCPALHPGDWGDARIDASLYRSADAVFALSRFERERVVEMGVDARRVHVLPLGPTVTPGGDGTAFRALHGVGDRPLVTFLARRSRHKGLEVVVEAARRLRQDGLDLALAVGGFPGDADAVVASLPGVIDVGVCDERTKADLLAASDVLCVPSVSEALGIVYLDAWSAGVPVIASRAPAVQELVRDDVDGLLVEQTVDDVSAALRRLLADAALRRRLGAAGRERQRRDYSWEAFARVQREVFTGLGALAAEAHRGPPPRAA